MESIFNSLKSNVNERVSSPLLSSFILAWLTLNWRVSLVIFSGGATSSEKIDHINRVDIFWIYPLGISLAWVFLWPFINYVVVYFSESRSVITKNMVKKQRSKALLSEEEAHQIRVVHQNSSKQYRELLREKNIEFDELMNNYSRVFSLLNERQAKGLEEEKNEKRKNHPFLTLLKPSPELSVIIGVDPIARTEVVKKLWTYIKEHNLQNPKNKREIIADKKLRALFKKDIVNMFEMTKIISKHLDSIDE